MGFIEQKGECKLFGEFGFIVQVFLGALCLGVLIIKRYLQYPRRPWMIWILDTSKQAFSQVHSHFINVAMALLLSKQFSEDGCVWYLINIVLDTTFGTLLCYGFLFLVNRCAENCGCPGLVSGNYYHKRTYQINCGYWVLQLLIWCGIVSLSKTLFFLIQEIAHGYLERAGHWVIELVPMDPEIRLIMVMVVVPVTLNCLQFWIQDSFLRAKRFPGSESSLVESEDLPASQRRKVEINHQEKI